MKTILRGVAMLGIALTTMLGVAQQVQAQNRVLRYNFTNLIINDEDDPFSNDEPYLVVTRFRARVQMTNGQVSVIPSTLFVENRTTGQNNLGRSGDNWADEPNNYLLPSNLLINFSEVLPANQMWVSGAVVTFMEEDGFSMSVSQTLANLVRNQVRSALNNVNFQFSAQSIANGLQRQIMAELGRSVRTLNFGGIIQSIAGLVDPDDFGGVRVVMALTGVGNGAFVVAGNPPSSVGDAIGSAVAVNGAQLFNLHYSEAGLASIPWNARYTGSADVRVLFRVQ